VPKVVTQKGMTSGKVITNKNIEFETLVFEFYCYCKHFVIIHTIPDSKSSMLIEFSLKSPCLHPVFGPPFTPYPLLDDETLVNFIKLCKQPLFELGPQSKLFNLGIKC
jgi:hypothetical protein